MESSDFDAAISKSNMSEGDTIEYIMNTPCTTVVDAPVQDFSALYPHEAAISDEEKRMRRHRELIEAKLRKQVLAQERECKMGTTEVIPKKHVPQYDYQDDGNGIEDTEGFYAIQEAFDTDCEEILLSTSPSDHTRRASEPNLSQNTSSIEVPSTLYPVSQVPIYLPSSTTPHTPVTHSSHSRPSYPSSSNARLYYANPFSAYSSKPLPPSKIHHGTSLTDTTTQLSHATAIAHAEADEAAALQDLEKYRAMDLAPPEPVMQNKAAGDLITHGTPVKARDADIFTRANRTSGSETGKQEFHTGVNTQVPKVPHRQSQGIKKNEEQDVHAETADAGSSLQGQHEAARPTFITVLEMLPAALLWCTIAAVTQCSLSAFDTLVELVTGLRTEH